MSLFIQLAGESVYVPSHWSITGHPRAHLRQQNLSIFSERKGKIHVSLDWGCTGAWVPCRAACCRAAPEHGSRAVPVPRATQPCPSATAPPELGCSPSNHPAALLPACSTGCSAAFPWLLTGMLTPSFLPGTAPVGTRLVCKHWGKWKTQGLLR